jgi:hypothetical protein
VARLLLHLRDAGLRRQSGIVSRPHLERQEGEDREERGQRAEHHG